MVDCGLQNSLGVVAADVEILRIDKSGLADTEVFFGHSGQIIEAEPRVVRAACGGDVGQTAGAAQAARLSVVVVGADNAGDINVLDVGFQLCRKVQIPVGSGNDDIVGIGELVGIIEHRVVPFAAGNKRFAVSKPFTVERDERLIVYVQLSDVAYVCEIGARQPCRPRLFPRTGVDVECHGILPSSCS